MKIISYKLVTIVRYAELKIAALSDHLQNKQQRLKIKNQLIALIFGVTKFWDICPEPKL